MQDVFAVNGRYRTRPVTGVQRYATEVVAALGARARVLTPSSSWSSGSRGHAWEQSRLSLLTRGQALWSPCNVGPVLSGRHAVTIHDVSPLDHPEWFRRQYAAAMRVLLPALVRHAAHVFTVSEFSRSRLVELVGVPEDRVSITYNGVRAGEGVAPSAGELEAMNLTPTSRFFLVVGSLEPRKNLAGLLKAFSAWAGAADVELVIVGDVGSSRVFADSPAVRNTPGVRLLGRVSDTQLSSLYRTALACVFVPLYEGFGLPPVEALAHGCRVIASDIPPLHEACGSLATFVDPRSRSEIVAAFDQVLTSSPPAGDLLRAHLSKFDWKVTADAVAARMEQL